MNVELTEAQRGELETRASGRTSPVRMAERSKMMLRAAAFKVSNDKLFTEKVDDIARQAEYGSICMTYH